MTYKDRYVQIIKSGVFKDVKYYKGEIWQITDDNEVTPDIINKKGKKTVVFLNDEAELLPEDYSPDNVQPNEISIQLW